jgi:hypothetical protein
MQIGTWTKNLQQSRRTLWQRTVSQVRQILSANLGAPLGT